ncbi:MAG: hypothetical protein SPI25_04820 [Dialister sp.]|nr:hypothetical protein [Dialister sp.]
MELYKAYPNRWKDIAREQVHKKFVALPAASPARDDWFAARFFYPSDTPSFHERVSTYYKKDRGVNDQRHARGGAAL